MFGAIAAIAAPVVGGLLGAKAAKDAASIQAESADRATEEQRRQFDLTRADQAPWLQVGQNSIRTIGDLLKSGSIFPDFRGEDLINEPGYAFRLGEGEKAIERAARARGNFMSPSTVKGLLRYGQDYASGEFQNAFNRDLTNKTTKFNMLSGASGGGQTAANTLANAGSTMAGNVGQLMTGSGNARGAASIAGANAISGGINTIGNWYQQQQNRDSQEKMLRDLIAARSNGGFAL